MCVILPKTCILVQSYDDETERLSFFIKSDEFKKKKKKKSGVKSATVLKNNLTANQSRMNNISKN